MRLAESVREGNARVSATPTPTAHEDRATPVEHDQPTRPRVV
jgi:hypothetical protein